MGLKAAVQALKKAEPLKDKVQRCKDLLNDNDAWVCQQQLQKIYQQVLILDLEYALDRKVEQELWNLGFKNYIATLQSQAKDRKNPKRGESQAMLSWCLEAASGFYLTLLQEICTAFDLDLPFRRKGYVYGCTSPWKAVEKLSAPHKSSCFYACQYCLVHLGDIARYRNQNKQAELFYRHAVSLSPSSGQPYNQLALLEASRGDKLGTVFHYARSVAVKHPFPVATANLAKTLSSALNDSSFNVDGKTKLSSQEYVAVFLKLHGVLHNLGNLTVASTYVKLLTETLTALIATESFSSWRLVQMLVINLYALQHIAGSSDSSELLKIEQLSSDEKLARDCIMNLIAGNLSALLLPVYTIKNSIIDYYALPTIKLCLDWIRLKPTVLEEAAFTSRLQIWPSLCVLLNGLQGSVADFKHDCYNKVPLPEDRDLQGFLPLEKTFESLRFTNTDLEGDTATLNKLRAVRILHLGRRLAHFQVNGSTLIALVTGEASEERFTSVTEGTGPSNELMKELEELTLNKDRQSTVTASPVPSESASSKGSWEADLSEHGLEKRGGILKPQGSLERSRDPVNPAESNVEANSTQSTRKPRQNVAMQAIMRRAETEQKQVTFKNVSPVIIEEETSASSALTSPSKGSQPSLRLPGLNGVNASPGLTGSGQSRPGLMQVGSVSGQPMPGQGQGGSMQGQNVPLQGQNVPLQGQSVPLQSQSASLAGQVVQKPVKLQLNIPQPPSQMSQFPIEQQSSNVAQYCQQAQGLPQTCYQSPSFNVQNPQFNKNFLTTRAAGMPQYQMQSQFNGTLQSLPQQSSAMQQNVGMQQNVALQQSVAMQQNVVQNRQSLHQRMARNISQSPVLQQGMTLSAVQANAGLQDVGLHQQTVMQAAVRSNGVGLQGPMAVAGPGVAGSGQGPQAVSGFGKGLQQAVPQLANLPGASMSPTSLTGLQLGFGPGFGQFNQMTQKQMSPIAYGNKHAGRFAFPGQSGPGKSPQPVNSYPMFHTQENKDFSPWKDTQLPQPPMAWWGSGPGPAVGHAKDMPGTDAFQNWANSPGPGGMIGRVPLTPGNSYQQAPTHAGPYARNCFEDNRPFEMEQKQPHSPGTGNTYSLFSGNTWGMGSSASSTPSGQDQAKARLSQQSLWSGPGPSPLERLLEQQKSLREGGT
ncbi:protein SMG7 [Orussus abietinus]|uniref:protein SMG7 n=1 Tax=Orussus abietinus TaxID=222816 RepID=UPI000626D9BA|nr:protein SMG7 [Orussus abietinus]XP_012278201.1 protein SMG7 [Orussus abietinus]